MESVSPEHSKQTIRKLKTVRKLFRAKRADPKTRLLFRAVDDMIKEKQAQYFVKQETFFTKLLHATIEKLKKKKEKKK